MTEYKPPVYIIKPRNRDDNFRVQWLLLCLADFQIPTHTLEEDGTLREWLSKEPVNHD